MTKKYGLLFILNTSLNCSSSLKIEDSVISQFVDLFSEHCDRRDAQQGIYCFTFNKYHVNVFLVKSTAKKDFDYLKEIYL